MALWSGFLEIFQASLFWLTQFYGGQLGAAIVSLSLLARLALLPLSVRVTLRARAHARRLHALQPQLRKVRLRWADDPKRQTAETVAVYERAGLQPVDPGSLKGTLLQMPVFLGLFHAVRAAVGGRIGEQSFLWVASLARPDVGVALVAAALAGAGALVGASEPRPPWTLALPVLSVGVMALVMSAGFGLYLAASGAVGTLQALIVRRIETRASEPT